MALFRAESVIIKVKPFGEADKILTVFRDVYKRQIYGAFNVFSVFPQRIQRYVYVIGCKFGFWSYVEVYYI